ncbi:MAG TPA: cytochrome c oxidase subunit II [Nevskiaceae bacterium]|nr:cytochrome c oxidase subunit II [Nevskiaceae bacterium]
MLNWKRVAGGLTLSGLAVSAVAHASLEKDAFWNLPSGVTPLSHAMYREHMYGFYVMVFLSVVVFGTMFYSMWAHRRRRHPVPSKFHENTRVETIWTIIPFLILATMAFPAAGTLVKAYNTNNAYMTVKVTGAQWRWEYEYPDFGVGFVSSISASSNKASMLDSGINPDTVPHYLRSVDHPMVVPVDKKIRLLITSVDVDHAWSVADLGVKKNAYPGYINEAWFKADRIGTYRGQCTVLCGRGHSYMPTVVKVVSLQDFNAWVKQQLADKHTLHLGDGCDAAAAAGDAVGKIFPVPKVCGTGTKAHWLGTGAARHGSKLDDLD